MIMESLDNLSVVMIGLKGFKNSLQLAWQAKQKNLKSTYNNILSQKNNDLNNIYQSAGGSGGKNISDFYN